MCGFTINLPYAIRRSPYSSSSTLLSLKQRKPFLFLQMFTRVFLFLLFTIASHALYFPPGSHNARHGHSTGGTVTINPPTKLVRRQTTPSSTLKPIISIPDINATDWATQTNQLCTAAINITSITNPAGVVPCYNVLSFDPNNGGFLCEVRLFQVVSMEQPQIMAGSFGSGVLFEFPHAEIAASPAAESISQMLTAGKIRKRQSSLGQVNLVDAFYMNGTADITQQYISPKDGKLIASVTAEQLLTPTTAILNLNMSSGITPFSLTSSMVMFVNGLFSPEFTTPQTNSTYLPAIFCANVRSQAPVTPAPSASSIPGITFGITPIGFYMFSVYWAVFMTVIFWGAWNKWKVIPLFGFY